MDENEKDLLRVGGDAAIAPVKDVHALECAAMRRQWQRGRLASSPSLEAKKPRRFVVYCPVPCKPEMEVPA